MKDKAHQQPAVNSLTFGFDIGIASVGWAVLSPTRIIDLGVRAFDKAETAKEGDSLNLVRRTARLMRRRLQRRVWRLTKLARLLKRQGVIDSTSLFRPEHPYSRSLWQLRVDALDRQLDAEEWARVIYHLCKHRGFHWVSRAEEKKAEGDSKSEGGKVKQGLAGTAKLMQEKKYRSAAEMVLAEFPDAQRNKQGDYSKALKRELLGNELALLFDQQRGLGNPHATQELQIEILGTGGLFWAQKPSLAGGKLLEMLGRCTFERPGGPDGKGEYRAPKASFTAERHVWLTRLNNLRIVVDGTTRPLNDAERKIALPLPYQQAGDFTYKQLHDALVNSGHLPKLFRFASIAYPIEAEKSEGKAKHPEAERLIKLPAYQELRKALKDAGLETEWEGMKSAAIDGNPELLDQIAWVLSVYKTDEEVETELRKLSLPGGDKMIDALLDLRFDKFHALSLKALRQIVPQMETGLRYDEACEKAGYHHSQLFKIGSGDSKYLPPFYSGRDKTGRMIFNEKMDIPRNPVVLRALNQARKVINALIRKYGSPHAVHIELARDLSRPMDERNKVKKAQDEFRDRNEKSKAEFVEEFGMSAKSKEFEKYQLYREQQGKCAYSIEPIDINRLFEAGYVEVDHALPYSRSFDDSKNNKVLVLAKENRNKGNQTPYEYLDGASNSERWRRFATYVEFNKAYRLAKRSRLLRKEFGQKEAEEFRERNLNDTRYICKFFKNYVERHLQLAADSNSKRCVVVSGQLTAFLRARWGLVKVRGDSDRHHALDAAVVAACSHGMVKRLSDYSRRKELEKVREGFIDMETGEIVNPVIRDQLEQHFPDPWPHFRHELKTRLELNDLNLLREEMQRLGSYSEESLQSLRTLFVSRAPQRRNGGALHEETIRSAKSIESKLSYVSIPLQKLKLTDLEQIVGAHDPRNAPLIDLLRERLQKHDGDGKKAFSMPLFKPSAADKKAPLVRTIKLLSTQNSGVMIRGGLADQGEMLCVDIYRYKNKYLIEPVYGISKEKRINPSEIPNDTEFHFSLTKNDYVQITLGNIRHEGYFVMYESDGRMTLRAHDQPKPDKEYFRKGVASALKIEKFHVDVLGNAFPAHLEPRRGLA